MIRNEHLFLSAEKLRKSGKSYSEIRKVLTVSKGTLSGWFSNKKWSQSVKRQLVIKYKDQNTNRIIEINKIKHLQTLDRYDEYRKKANTEYIFLRKEPLFLSGMSIYWGEGEKTANGRVSIVNSDSTMVQVMANFYRKILKIPEQKIRAAIFLYKDIDPHRALNYWSQILRISKKQFIKTQILPNRGVFTKRKVINGMCNIYFSNTEMNIKMNEWIKLLGQDMSV